MEMAPGKQRYLHDAARLTPNYSPYEYPIRPVPPFYLPCLRLPLTG